MSNRNVIKIKLDLPITIECTSCGDFLSRGLKFTAEKITTGKKVFGINVLNFKIKCPSCASEIIFGTNIENETYDVISGAHETAASRRNQEKIKESRELRAKLQTGAANAISLKERERMMSSSEFENVLSQKAKNDDEKRHQNIFVDLWKDDTENYVANSLGENDNTIEISQQSRQIDSIVEIEKLKLQAMNMELKSNNIEQSLKMLLEAQEKASSMVKQRKQQKIEEYLKLKAKLEDKEKIPKVEVMYVSTKKINEETEENNDEKKKFLNNYKIIMHCTLDELKNINKERISLTPESKEFLK